MLRRLDPLSRTFYRYKKSMWKLNQLSYVRTWLIGGVSISKVVWVQNLMEEASLHFYVNDNISEALHKTVHLISTWQCRIGYRVSMEWEAKDETGQVTVSRFHIWNINHKAQQWTPVCLSKCCILSDKKKKVLLLPL